MMKKRNAVRPLECLAAALVLLAGLVPGVSWAEGEDPVVAPWKIETYYENATFVREDVNLSKFRNTIQIEGDRKLGQSGAFQRAEVHFKLRGTYDGVYDLNKDKYGNNAGGPISLPNSLSGTGETAWGAGIPIVGGFSTAANPNQGLLVLGSRLHAARGFSMGVPVRPCNADRRGCTDFGGYGDLNRNELASPEFNDRLDFVREAYFSGSLPLSDGKELFLKVGKQQVVWGRTDLFRVLDVINPVDYSRNNIFDELQDIRIPMWIAQAEYRMGATPTFDDLNFSVVWNFDKFRPHNLGQGGSPNSILDAGSFFRAMKNCWDNGCTIGGFGPGRVAVDFAPGAIGIRKAQLPEWSLKNTQLGVKLEGVASGVGFSINALSYRSQLPSLRGNIVSPALGADVPFLPALDVAFPRVNLIGASMDIQAESIKSVFRLEAALTHGEEFANTAREDLFSESRVFRYVIGWDRPTFIPFLNKDRTFLISAQLFGQHLLDHELLHGANGPVGISEWKNNNIVTLLFKGFYQNDRLSPQIVIARDIKAKTTVLAPSMEWLYSDNLKLGLGANVKRGEGAHEFDDDTGSALGTMSNGLASFEPLGRFRAGPIGSARNENEIQFTLRYKF